MTASGVLTPQELSSIDAWWRVANYLSVRQIYLLAKPLLRDALRPEHIKPRLLGHWGTTPGLSFVCTHARLRARVYTREVGDDIPEVRDWTWPGSSS